MSAVPVAASAAHEAERLRVLAGLDVIGMPSDPVLEGLVRCAAQLLGCPVAQVSLVDADRQWSIAQVGGALSAIPRERAICAHAILSPAPFVVGDLAADARFANDPDVAGGAGWRFYAGIPFAVDGQRLGALCVLDRVPRTLDTVHQQLLQDLGAAVATWFQARRAHRQATDRVTLLEGISREVPGLIFQACQRAGQPPELTYLNEPPAPALAAERALLQSLAQQPAAWRAWVHADDQAALQALLAELRVAPRPWRLAFRLAGPPQAEIWREAHATPLPQADGSMLWHGMLTDISQRKRSEAAAADSSRRWQLAVDAAELGLVTIDVAARRIEFDPRACAHHRWTGTPAWLSLQAWLGLFSFDAEQRASLLAQIESIGPGQTLSLQGDLGPVRALEPCTLEIIAQASNSAEGGAARLVGTCRDVTGQLSVARLRSEKLAAERASHEKSEFLSRVSHELRTPLNAILGFNQLLEGDPLQPLSSQQRQYVQHAQTAGRLLLGLINDMLDLGRIEQGMRALQLQPVDSQALAAGCIAMLAQVARDAGIRLDLQVPGPAPAVLADPRALEQVLLNLLSNGIKYNRPGGLLQLALLADAHQGRIVVRDQGPGMSQVQLDQLFQPFNRLGAEHSAIEGSGLGLVIARQLTEAMGGSLQASSAPGQGAVFTVALPLQTPGAPAPGQALPPAGPGTAPRSRLPATTSRHDSGHDRGHVGGQTRRWRGPGRSAGGGATRAGDPALRRGRRGQRAVAESGPGGVPALAGGRCCRRRCSAGPDTGAAARADLVRCQPARPVGD